MLGGGRNQYIHRADNLNLINYAEEKGYKVVTTLEGITRLFESN